MKFEDPEWSSRIYQFSPHFSVNFSSAFNFWLSFLAELFPILSFVRMLPRYGGADLSAFLAAQILSSLRGLDEIRKLPRAKRTAPSPQDTGISEAKHFNSE